jgi:hypothetical protein
MRAGIASAKNWQQPLEISPDAKSWQDTHPKFRQVTTSR